MPTNYQIIAQAINHNNAIRVHWSQDDTSDPDRRLLPYVLGQSDIPGTRPPRQEDMVLGYQFEGPDVADPNDPSNERLNWRCFHVDDLTTVSEETFSEAWMPPTMTGRQRARQNCVQFPDVWRRDHA